MLQTFRDSNEWNHAYRARLEYQMIQATMAEENERQQKEIDEAKQEIERMRLEKERVRAENERFRALLQQAGLLPDAG